MAFLIQLVFECMNLHNIILCFLINIGRRLQRKVGGGGGGTAGSRSDMPNLNDHEAVQRYATRVVRYLCL